MSKKNKMTLGKFDKERKSLNFKRPESVGKIPIHIRYLFRIFEKDIIYNTLNLLKGICKGLQPYRDVL
jgi:hypothetical protein